MSQSKEVIGESIWSRDIEFPERKPLEKDMDIQVAVIGAGMAGLLTAFHLGRQGLDVVVLEADRIAGGQTKNTTAKITSQHGLIYSSLLQKYGTEEAGMYARANEIAINSYGQIIEENKIQCGFERIPSYLYSRADKQSLEQEADAAAGLGIKSFFTEKNDLPFPAVGAVCFEEQAQFHPLEFIRHISEGLTIYERTRVISVKGHKIQTDRGNVTAEHIVFATHYPFINVPGFYFMRQHQQRSYVLALSGAATYKGMYYSADQGGISLRNDGDILLFGGGGHRTGENTCGGVYRALAAEAKRYYPDCQVIAGWSAQDCMPHDDIPFIGRYSVYRPYWYVATGFKKWGMTSSMISARIISNQICGLDNPYESLFSPQRFHFRAAAKPFLKDVGISVKGLTRGLFHPGKRCPHMGCGLKWNPDENSWDCPCHGSRFSSEGDLIDDPAQKGCKVKKRAVEV